MLHRYTQTHFKHDQAPCFSILRLPNEERECYIELAHSVLHSSC